MKVLIAAGIGRARGARRRLGADEVPAGFLGTWASLGLNPGPPPLGAPPTELPYTGERQEAGRLCPTLGAGAARASNGIPTDTGQVCKLDGIFVRDMAPSAGNFRFVETPDKLYQVWSSVDEHGLQRIYFNSPRPRNRPADLEWGLTWPCRKRQHLIVDTIGFNDKSWLSSDRVAHSEELHVVERYRLYGGGAYIQLRVFVADRRRALKEPYTYTRYRTGRWRCRPKGARASATRTRLKMISGAFAATSCLRSMTRSRLALMTIHKLRERARLPTRARSRIGRARRRRRREDGRTPDTARLRALAGIYEALPAVAALPGGLKSAGRLSESRAAACRPGDGEIEKP
jgi:hypothetical protein